MKYYLAPLEGLTGYVYRNAYAKYFGEVDRYFTPFIAANQHGKFSTRELHDILPEHNKGLEVVPQILTNNAEDFIRTSKQLKDYGYEEVNLNLGCPSGTVVTKYKGSGFLAKPEELDRFLEEVFKANITKISVKTRLGKEEPEEFYKLLDIFNQYPMTELIIHPRVQKDYYKGVPRKELFKEALALSKNPVCYNGDLFTVEDLKQFTQEYQKVDKVMLGRGLIANPGLVGAFKANKQLDKAVFKAFHDQLLGDYEEVLSGDRNVLFKMKEMWFYMNHMFTNYEKYGKKIKKSQKVVDYKQAVDKLFEEQEIVQEAGLFSQPLR